MTVSEAGMLGASDQDHLVFARREGRVLFTQDADFLRLHALGVEHSGIVYARQQTAISEMIQGLMLVFEFPMSEMILKGEIPNGSKVIYPGVVLLLSIALRDTVRGSRP